jgi:hypothetical protein
MIKIELITNDIYDGSKINVPCLPPVGALFTILHHQYIVHRVIFESDDSWETTIRVHLEKR